MELKPIKNCSGYFISDSGEIYSNKSGEMKRLATYLDSKKRYVICKLICDDKKRRPFLVHRLVAEHFIENPEDLPVVDHIDDNPQNNDASNLQWVSIKENVQKEYTKLGPIRNRRNTVLLFDRKPIKSFESINEACRYAELNFGASYSSLNKHRVCGKIRLISENSLVVPKSPTDVRNTNTINIYANGEFLFSANNCVEASALIKSNMGLHISSKTINRILNGKRKQKETITFTRASKKV